MGVVVALDGARPRHVYFAPSGRTAACVNGDDLKHFVGSRPDGEARSALAYAGGALLTAR
ncbi:MAG: hypothetical protein M3417_11165 [Actinomycetota bacterium]|nr:hypothetical protein [Actinomycetota bacterium]